MFDEWFNVSGNMLSRGDPYLMFVRGDRNLHLEQYICMYQGRLVFYPYPFKKEENIQNKGKA